MGKILLKKLDKIRPIFLGKILLKILVSSQDFRPGIPSLNTAESLTHELLCLDMSSNPRDELMRTVVYLDIVAKIHF